MKSRFYPDEYYVAVKFERGKWRVIYDITNAALSRVAKHLKGNKEGIKIALFKNDKLHKITSLV